MSDSSNYVNVYSGSMVSIKNLERKLAEAGISSIVEDEYDPDDEEDGFGPSASSLHLYISDEDMESAKGIIAEHTKPAHKR